MAVNGRILDVGYDGGILKEIKILLFWTGTYTLNGAGDILDLTNLASAPAPLPGQFPSQLPNDPIFDYNGGDMGGAYLGLLKPTSLKSMAIRFYQANGTELATNAAYPAGTPATAAASNVQLTITGRSGKF